MVTSVPRSLNTLSSRLQHRLYKLMVDFTVTVIIFRSVVKGYVFGFLLVIQVLLTNHV